MISQLMCFVMCMLFHDLVPCLTVKDDDRSLQFSASELCCDGSRPLGCLAAGLWGV